MSSAFDKFKDSYFRHPSREGPDLAVLEELDESERKAAEALLLDSLAPDKIYSIQALGYLRSQQAFNPLIELLPKAKGIAKVYIAEALWRIGKYEPALSILCQTLLPPKIFGLGDANARREAAIALGEINERASIEALSVAMKDRDHLVQYHARRSLAILLGLQKELEAAEQAITGSAHQWQKASQEFGKLVEKALDNYSQQR